MTTFPPSSRRSGWPLGLLGMLALVAGLEALAAKKSDRYTSTTTEIWSYPRRATRNAVGCEVIAFGDSLIKNGVLPKVLERQLEVRSFNLAITGGHAAGSYFLLRRTLQLGASPKVVLVDGEMLCQDPKAPVRLWPEIAGPMECAELGFESRDLSFFSTIVVSSVLPSYKARLELRTWMLASLSGLPESSFHRSLFPLFRRIWDRNRGADPKPPYVVPASGDNRVARLGRDTVRTTPWQPDPVNLVYVERFLDLARSRKIAVLWLIPPCHPEIQRRREASGLYSGYVAYLREIAARYPNVTVVEGRDAGYGSELLTDMVHLDAGGAILFTHALVPLIRKALTSPLSNHGPNWVALPPPPGDQSRLIAEHDADVEDYDEVVAAFKRWEQKIARGEVSADGKILRR